jgi:hypothetical protein
MALARHPGFKKLEGERSGADKGNWHCRLGLVSNPALVLTDVIRVGCMEERIRGYSAQTRGTGGRDVDSPCFIPSYQVFPHF